jgi:hypothetical protein
MASDQTTDSGSGWADFLFIVAAFLGVLAFGITILAVSLPHGLKFVLAAIVGMLTLICVGLIGVPRR